MESVINSAKKECLLHFQDLKETFKNLSQNKIYGISLLLSTLFSYKYLKNKHLYSEFNGHFNSPQNKLNKVLFTFYLKEGVIRFSFGFIFFMLSLTYVKSKLGGYEEELKKIYKTTDLVVVKQEKQKDTIDGSEIDVGETEYHDPISKDADYIQESLKRKNNVQKYLSK